MQNTCVRRFRLPAGRMFCAGNCSQENDMLLEKTSYSNDFPLQIRVMQVKDYPLHYHQDIELVYVLEGEINLRSGYCTYQLHEGDLFCNNGHEVH